jgi:hypothetical protein
MGVYRGISQDNLVILSGSIDAAPIGQTTPAAGSFTTLTASSGVTGKVRIPVTTPVTPLGANQAGAAPLVEGLSVVVGANDALGVRLPTAVEGAICIVKTTTAAKTLLVYPATGAAINAIAANGALTMAAVTSAMFVASSATQWYTVPLLPS